MLIHEVILEWIKWGNTEVPVCRLTTAADCRLVEGEGEGVEERVLEKLFKVRLLWNL